MLCIFNHFNVEQLFLISAGGIVSLVVLSTSYIDYHLFSVVGESAYCISVNVPSNQIFTIEGIIQSVILQYPTADQVSGSLNKSEILTSLNQIW